MMKMKINERKFCSLLKKKIQRLISKCIKIEQFFKHFCATSKTLESIRKKFRDLMLFSFSNTRGLNFMWCGNKRACLIMKKLLLKGRKKPYFSLLYSKPSLRLRTEPFFCEWKLMPSWIEMLQLHHKQLYQVFIFPP